MSLKGKLLGSRYELVEKIGNGGMSTVYRATDKVLKRNVAVKILRDEFTTDEEFIKRFEAEAQSAARLTHANIVSIYDVGVEGNLYYIVMELIQGKTLKEIIIEERGPLPWKWSVNVAIQIASALEIAHRNNIVHRDIKPHNIIITEDGVAKVTDFGIAKAVSNSTITAFGTTIGSVHYFSPEHARGGFTDAKSDLYSLGVVMYEMVTGKVPFDADTPVSVALKHMQEEPEEPIKSNPNVPTAINKMIMKALQKDATLRYQSATEMLEDLKRSLKNPDGDFVEELEYDSTARTQVIDTEMYGDIEDKPNNRNKRGKKEGKFKQFVKKHKVLSVMVGLILLFSLSLGGTLAVLSVTNPAEVEMPNVVGLSKEEAQKEIENAKLVFEVEKEEYHKEVPEGSVISQDPTYMERFHKVKEGSTVSVIISKGQEANTEVFAGDNVILHVSTGVEKAKVPDVVGKTQADAKSTLEAQGFTVSVSEAEDSSKAKGVVLKQSLDAGKTVEKGSSITITVNSFEEAKNMTVNIDVKTITGGYTTEPATTNNTANNTNATHTTTTIAKTVSIVLKSGNTTLYSDSGVDKNTKNKSATINGKGSMDLTLTITDSKGGSWTRTKTVNFNNDKSINF